jgi:putative flippase GtrA
MSQYRTQVPMSGMRSSGRAAVRALVAEFAKFGVVGAVCTVIDIGLFNVFHLTVGMDPLWAKTSSVAIATTCSYFGNRHWSFRHRARNGFGREYVRFFLFFVLNALGLLPALGALAVAKYVLHLTGPLALNLAGNVVGMGLGTGFRFWAYRRWVFLADASPSPVDATLLVGRSAPIG